MKTVVYTPEALADIESIWDYTSDRWGLEQAWAYDRRLEQRILGIATGRIASQSADRIAPTLRRAIAERHVVFFREDNKQFAVVRVLHERMDVGQALSDLDFIPAELA